MPTIFMLFAAFCQYPIKMMMTMIVRDDDTSQLSQSLTYVPAVSSGHLFVLGTVDVLGQTARQQRAKELHTHTYTQIIEEEEDFA